LAAEQKSDLKRLDEDRKAELTQVVEKYLKIRDAIVETLIAKEIALIAERYLRDTSFLASVPPS
jgi:hypothetical protein